MKKWLIPIAYPFISVLAFILSGLLGYFVGDSLAGAVYIVLGLVVYCAIAIPMICFLYSKRCLAGQRYRVLFTLYQSFFITLPFLIWFSFLVVENEPGLKYIAPIIFVWCELWSLIGLKKTRSASDTEKISEETA